VEAQIVTIDHYTMPAGWVGGKHYHTGPVYVYVLEGSFAVDEQGKARQTIKAGELYKEPIGTPMQARNLNASEPLKVLVIQVTPEGEPPMIKAE
jgi:quercetin dioxygenase-like cupin family protein